MPKKMTLKLENSSVCNFRIRFTHLVKVVPRANWQLWIQKLPQKTCVNDIHQRAGLLRSVELVSLLTGD
jgi:hypothetical protein